MKKIDKYLKKFEIMKNEIKKKTKQKQKLMKNDNNA